MLGTSGVVDNPRRRPRCFSTAQEQARLKLSDIGTLLDRKIAAAMAAGSSGPLGDTSKRLNTIHEALKAQRASGLLTEEQYAKEAGGLLNVATWAAVQRTK
jgi:hypothetical protein